MLVGSALAASGFICQASEADFHYFKYCGNDKRFNVEYDATKQYLNPIISGFYPDPSIAGHNGDYYIVNSSFAYFPAIPIFHSNDLVHWEQIGHVVDDPSKLNLNGTDPSGGIFAPAIEYNKNNGTWYMTTGNISKGFFFFCKSKDPKKGWSDPIRLSRGGMDTSFFFDDDGKGYLLYHSKPADVKYPRERSLTIVEFDPETDQIVGEPRELLRGGSKCEEFPAMIEGPHIFKKDSYYYLIAPQGGTEINHCEVVFRSKNVYGPWEDCPYNPIVTQRDLTDYNRKDPVINTGHADMVEDEYGNWYAVFLGCRAYGGSDYFNTGRETFMLPVTWKDGWPVILDKGKAVPTIVDKPNIIPSGDALYTTGNFCLTDDFKGNNLNQHWVFLRNPDTTAYKVEDGKLRISPSIRTLRTNKRSPSAAFYRQKNTTFTAETLLDYIPTLPTEFAGISVFQNGSNFVTFGKTLVNGKIVVQVYHINTGIPEVFTKELLEGDAHSPILLRVSGDEGNYSFCYSLDEGKQWKSVAEKVDCRNLSTKVAGGFVGAMIGLYATTSYEQQ